ncbi:hypothetical protein RI129_000765 [Pyrocoelia pectoralis]|uniref:Uncharacterized protein n=1 Tax=Pyrocoelia pectoralis TaxID=417401 RepID=A0AAN7VS52_9COLE
MSPSCFCVMCHQLYVEPPVEDWIKCCKCEEWCHEDCSSYNGQGEFFCDLCL